MLQGAAALSSLGAHARTAAGSDFPTTWRFGDITVTKVVDLLDPYDAAKAYPGAPLDAFDQNADWLVPHFYDPVQKAILFSFHSYVVRTRRHTMVVDTCVGNDKTRGPMVASFNMRKGPYLDNLRAAGVRPEEVDFVMCTHFHSDHTGWNARLDNGKWVPTFPKAKYLFNRTELEGVQARVRAGGDATSYNDSILPVLDAGQAVIVDGDHPVDDGVKIVASPGHTSGHYSIALESRGRRAILAGDILHNPIEVLHPEWTCVFDQDKDAGIAGRKKFLDAHTDVDITVFAAHFGGPTAGHIVSVKGGRRFRTLVG